MKYGRKDAKAYSRENMKGIWAAALTPFTQDFKIDEKGFRRNLAPLDGTIWGSTGVFIGGKQGEFFSMSVAERKRSSKSRSMQQRKRGRRSCRAPTRIWTW